MQALHGRVCGNGGGMRIFVWFVTIPRLPLRLKIAK
jgi:hypothetical protein